MKGRTEGGSGAQKTRGTTIWSEGKLGSFIQVARKCVTAVCEGNGEKVKAPHTSVSSSSSYTPEIHHAEPAHVDTLRHLASAKMFFF